jgi:hypothetical protein
MRICNTARQPDLGLTTMVGAEVLGDDAALDADVEAGDLLVDDEPRAFLVQRDPGQELSLRLPGLPILR